MSLLSGSGWFSNLTFLDRCDELRGMKEKGITFVLSSTLFGPSSNIKSKVRIASRPISIPFCSTDES